MKNFLRGLLHVGISAAVVVAGQAIQSGAPLTSGNVLIPALLAAGGGMLHSALPTLLTKLSPPT